MDIADDQDLDFPLVTRVEVVDHTAAPEVRALVRYGVDVFAEVQDQGRTLKVFIHDRRSAHG
jgi:hypothetical protein